MFTGIIERTGTIRSVLRDTHNRSAIRLVVDMGKKPKGLSEGQSVALNGVCLTAVEIDGSQCTFELVEETLKKTSLGNLEPGGVVNVERSLSVGSRLEGHFVLGHVDGTATITKIKKKPKEVRVWFELPRRLVKYVVKKGSISLDGISLTIVSIKGRTASVSLIPHTLQITNLSAKKTGDRLNVEVDILGKYVLR